MIKIMWINVTIGDKIVYISIIIQYKELRKLRNHYCLGSSLPEFFIILNFTLAENWLSRPIIKDKFCWFPFVDVCKSFEKTSVDTNPLLMNDETQNTNVVGGQLWCICKEGSWSPVKPPSHNKSHHMTLTVNEWGLSYCENSKGNVL